MHEDEEGKKHARMNMPSRPETLHSLPGGGTGSKMVREWFLGSPTSKYIVGMIYEALFRARGRTFWKCSTDSKWNFERTAAAVACFSVAGLSAKSIVHED
jgi:hypothetical protein